jgi:hypothetical protein
MAGGPPARDFLLHGSILPPPLIHRSASAAVTRRNSRSISSEHQSDDQSDDAKKHLVTLNFDFAVESCSREIWLERGLADEKRVDTF